MPYYSRSYGYGGRRKYSKRIRKPAYRKPSLSTGPTADHLRIYRDPLSLATSNPKIPDGKSSHSCGIRLQSVKEFTNNTSGQMEFLFFPGLNNAVIAWNCYADTGTNPWDYSCPFTNHAVLKGTVPIDAGVEGERGEVIQQSTSKIQEWRVVSQASVVTLVNNSDENDGWWEAVRITVSDDDLFDLVQTDDATAEGVSTVTSQSVHVGSIFNAAEPTWNPAATNTVTDLRTKNPMLNSGSQLVEHPSYITGKLRDIHRQVFQLKPQGRDHDFNKLRSAYTYPDSATTPEFYEEQEGIRGTGLIKSNDHPLDSFIDRNYDAIYLRIHGRASDANASRLMVHTVQNQELVYDESSQFVRYHTNSKSSGLFPRVKKAVTESTNKAAQPKKKRKFATS